MIYKQDNKYRHTIPNDQSLFKFKFFFIQHKFSLFKFHFSRDQTPSNWFVLAGAHDLLQLESSRAVHAVSRIIIHERFDLSTFNNDLALLRLTVPVQFNTHISPVCLPPLNSVLSAGTQCIIAGWGVAG
jgi:hypothetical protein